MSTIVPTIRIINDSWGRLTLEGRAKHVGGGGNLDFLNLVMMGIKRPLAMKAIHSCSTDRTIA